MNTKLQHGTYQIIIPRFSALPVPAR
jgi:hypothetical protein